MSLPQWCSAYCQGRQAWGLGGEGEKAAAKDSPSSSWEGLAPASSTRVAVRSMWVVG